MSKSRAKARRQQKRSGTRHTQPRVGWIRGLAIVVPLLVVAALFYVLTGSSTPADPEEAAQALPPAAELGAAATEVAVAPSSTATASAQLAAPTPTPLPAGLAIGAADRCRRHPRFARQLGFNERAIMSTSASSVKGLLVVQPAEGNSPERVFQDQTWDDAGFLGHMTFDRSGNVYLFPSPRVSLVDNPPAEQNTLYQIPTDGITMTAWLTLPAQSAPSAANPFGIMGTTYDCDTDSLYASSVAGSIASEERGKIVRIDLASATIVAELQGIDPFGLSVHNEPARPAAGEAADGAIGKRLYFGSARVAEVYSIALNEQGDFAGQPQLELTLPQPALKPWRIVWDTNGDLVVRAVPFDFNLIATSERIEVPFRFRRDVAGAWQFVE